MTGEAADAAVGAGPDRLRAGHPTGATKYTRAPGRVAIPQLAELASSIAPLTKLVVCECGARLIEFGYDIHRQEYHSGTVGNEQCHSEVVHRALEGRY